MVLILRREFFVHILCHLSFSSLTYILYIIANRHRAVPTYLNPYMYKRDSEGEILLDRGDEYYNDNIPYDGVYIHFAKQIMEVSSRRIELYAGYRIIITVFIGLFIYF